jgi:hypothetical protein
MFVLSQNHNICAEVVSVRVIKKREKEDKMVREISLAGTMASGKDITLARFNPDQEDMAVGLVKMFAEALIKKLPVFDIGGVK